MNIHSELEEKGNKIAEEIAEFVEKNPGNLLNLFNELHSPSKKAKNGAAKALTIVSERNPELLYPYLQKFVELFDLGDTILKWTGIDIVGNLSCIDSENKIGGSILTSFYDFLSDVSMITASHSIDSLGKVAINKPEFRNEITRELLRIETIERNDECKNILLGRTIISYSGYYDRIGHKEKEKVVSFVRKQLNNPRNATKKKAEEFLVTHSRKEEIKCQE